MGEGFPLWSLDLMVWEGQEPLRDWIYLFVSAFWNSALALFPLYLEIRNSDWTKTFAQIVLQKIAFLRPKKGINRLTGGPRGSRVRPVGQARPPASWPPRARLAWIFLPEFSIFSKNKLRPFLSRLDSV